MGKQLAYHVHLTDGDGNPVVFGPEDDVPAWAAKRITNPSAWAEDGDSGDDPDGDPAPGYDGWLKADLEAEVEKRNADRDPDDYVVVAGKGNVPDLVEALEADDQAAEA